MVLLWSRYFRENIGQGEGFGAFVRGTRTWFDKVLVRKLDASRPRSREVYLLAKGKQVK